MKRIAFVPIFAALAVLLGLTIYLTVLVLGGSGNGFPQQAFFFTPADQQDFQFGPVGGMGRGMMGRGRMGGMSMPGGMMGYYPELVSALSHDDAEEIATSYLASLNNPDLIIDEFEEYSHNFYVSLIEESTGRGAIEIIIDRFSGALQAEPHTMMWNEKYGMMGRNQQVQMPVTEQQAIEIAQNFLDEAYPGTEAEKIVTYYGYYTIMTMHEGRHYGMLSVNGYSGEVWYHTWHGMFISDVGEHD